MFVETITSKGAILVDGRQSLTITVAAAMIAGCVSVSSPGDHLLDGRLTKADIMRCLELPHKVGDRMYSPVPDAGNVFKPGYNFLVREPDGSSGFGYQEASQGHVTIRYPAHQTAVVLDVVRRNGVVYFGNEPTSCP